MEPLAGFIDYCTKALPEVHGHEFRAKVVINKHVDVCFYPHSLAQSRIGREFNLTKVKVVPGE